jgi:hypothetical protein
MATQCRNAACGGCHDRVELVETRGEAFAKGVRMVGFARCEKGLAAASDVRRRFDVEPREFKEFEGGEPDSGPQLVDVAGDEEREAHR